VNRHLLSSESGFSLLEILTVMIMVGIMAAMAFPRFGTTLSRQSVRGARNTIVTMQAKARASAISRGRRTAFAIAGGRLAIRSQNPVSGTDELVGRTIDTVTTRYGVTLTFNPTTRDTLVFDARGLGIETTTTTIIIAKSSFADTITIGPLGRIIR
jgi:prepilin-type N-terminal cleavage/methylation domain-containing protein